MSIGVRETPGLRSDFATWVQSLAFENLWNFSAKDIGLVGAGVEQTRFLELAVKNVQSSIGAEPETLVDRTLRAVRTAATGSLYWASADMTELAVSAGAQMPTWEPRVADFPSERGIIICATPYRRDEDPRIDHVAVSWSIEFPADHDPMMGIAVMVDTHLRKIEGGQLAPTGSPVLFLTTITDIESTGDQGLIHSTLSNSHSRLQHDDESALPLWSGIKDVPPTYTSGSVRPHVFLAAMIALMSSPGVSTVSEWRPSRQDRAWVKRHRREALDAVRILDVRRRPRQGSEGNTGREYHHRWMVDGHWRNQWYPSQNRHKPVWINAYVKGPDGAPMLTGEKVRVIR